MRCLLHSGPGGAGQPPRSVRPPSTFAFDRVGQVGRYLRRSLGGVAHGRRRSAPVPLLALESESEIGVNRR
jgi:hypothetical protein